MCVLCSKGTAGFDHARRDQVLRLLALIEEPDALATDDRLRLAGEILALTESLGGSFRCEALVAGADLG